MPMQKLSLQVLPDPPFFCQEADTLSKKKRIVWKSPHTHGMAAVVREQTANLRLGVAALVIFVRYIQELSTSTMDVCGKETTNKTLFETVPLSRSLRY